MAITLACPCGAKVVVSPSAAGTQAACSRCGQRLNVPALGVLVPSRRPAAAAPATAAPRRAYRPWALFALPALLVPALLGGIVWLAWPRAVESPIEHAMAPPEPPPAPQRPAVIAAVPEKKSSSIPPPPPPPKVETPAPKIETPPAPKVETPAPKIETPPAPKVKTPPTPMLVVERVEPARPRAGDTLTIHLRGSPASDGPLTFQYRLRADDDWQTAPKGEVVVPKLSAAQVVRVEMRALDGRGIASAVERRTWTIPAATVTKEEKLIGRPIRLQWHLKEGDAFVQDLLVTQKPNFRMLGTVFSTALRYRVTSRFTVEKVDADGGLIVKQQVTAAQLLLADDLTRGLLQAGVARLPGTSFTIHLSPKMEVTRFEGAGGKMALAEVALPIGGGFQMSGLLDRDGWKEMAQATFFQADTIPKDKARWKRPLTHSWGALGSWVGQTLYSLAARKGDVQKVDYALQIAYRPPLRGAAVGGALPVVGAKMAARAAGGSLLFDTARGRVVAAEERFHVVGVLTVNLLGSPAVVEIDEQQLFEIRIRDR